ncbi:cytochrome c-type biogenesis protein CcmE [Mizugakiibacter sediminis]|uniref:Cytochrome c-type biogenesis protein CcmE n=1 Tax=Mizugakiibacter sediminis TaxID=1475481 RepID=A0A0K8QRG8_9GAMM|nr:cytochrome c maturation protein CcmE [Mizugakiibacter sediminis]GAP67246.1 cytochrome c-type biogenesis protein CcmE [Mizugakiibacter sediminis]
MNPTRKRRMTLVLLILGAVGVAAALTVYALQQNMNYLLTPSQVLAGQGAGYKTFRLGGMVKTGSVRRDAHSLTVDFTVTDGDHDLPVEYTGILPDLFRENQAVIATGHMDGARFVATEVLAKHDENYMPKELAAAMAKAHAKHHVGTPDPGPGTRQESAPAPSP